MPGPTCVLIAGGPIIFQLPEAMRFVLIRARRPVLNSCLKKQNISSFYTTSVPEVLGPTTSFIFRAYASNSKRLYYLKWAAARAAPFLLLEAALLYIQKLPGTSDVDSCMYARTTTHMHSPCVDDHCLCNCLLFSKSPG